MRWLFFFCLVFCFISGISQIRLYRKNEIRVFLVAKNATHEHWYREGKALRILYKDESGNILNATGHLNRYDSTHMELERRNGKITTVIGPGSIISVQPWSGPYWVGIGITAAVGAAIAIPTFTALSNGSGNLGLIFPAAIAIADFFFVVAATPVLIVSDVLSIRSQKKGYQFFIAYY